MKTRFLKRVFGVALIFLCNTGISFAQWSGANSELTKVQQEINGTTNTLVNIICIILGLIGVGSLALAYAKHTKGDPSASDALSKVGFGLLVVIILIQVIKMTLLS